MKTVRLSREDATPDKVEGLVLSQEVKGDRGEPVFAKGRILAPGDVSTLFNLPWQELHCVAMEEGEIHEDEAGRRLALASAGEWVEVGAPSGGHWPLAAQQRGVLHVSVKALREVNLIDGLCVYSLYDGQIVEEGEVVARAKITPFVLEGTRLTAGEYLARGTRGLVRVRPFRMMHIGAVVQETLGARAMDRFRAALEAKVHWFGSDLIDPQFVRPQEESVAQGIEKVKAEGAQVIVIAGTRAMDLLDPAFRALERLEIEIERHGVPAHPGSLFWLAYMGDTPILGMPTCGLFSQATVFDLVLPRILSGERVTRADLAELGHGGFLTRDMAFRFPPYRGASKERGAVE